MKTTAATISEGKSHQSSQVSTSLDTEHLEILKNLFAFGLKNHDAINCNFCSQRSLRSLCLSSLLSFKHCQLLRTVCKLTGKTLPKESCTPDRAVQLSLCTSHVHNPQRSLATSLCPQAMFQGPWLCYNHDNSQQKVVLTPGLHCKNRTQRIPFTQNLKFFP